MRKASWQRLWQGALTITALLVLWHFASSTGIFGRTSPESSRLLLPPPTAVVSSLVQMVRSGYLLDNVSISVLRVLCGFVLAALIAVPLGVAMALSATIHNLADPVVRLLSPIPGVAWVPIAILWFGLGDEAAIFIIAIGSIFPILLSTVQGVHDVDPRLVDAARTMGADRWQVIHRVMFPSLIPYLVTGFRTGLSFAWRVVIAAEMVGVPKGIGYMLTVGRSTGQTEVTIVTMLVLGILMVTVEELIFNPLQTYTDTWRRPSRKS
jgi:NitT/TauT family transport system permease protein/taurine transport system permease protein/sulfonate transport system permease protein